MNFITSNGHFTIRCIKTDSGRIIGGCRMYYCLPFSSSNFFNLSSYPTTDPCQQFCIRSGHYLLILYFWNMIRIRIFSDSKKFTVFFHIVFPHCEKSHKYWVFGTSFFRKIRMKHEFLYSCAGSCKSAFERLKKNHPVPWWHFWVIFKSVYLILFQIYSI